MATYKADIKTTSAGSIYSVTVEAGASYVAREEIQRLYDPIFIRNLREVRDSSSSGSGIGDVSGTAALVGLIAAAFLLVSFTPWVLMGFGGAFGLWVGEMVTGQSVEEYTSRDDDKGHTKAAIVLALTLFAGGFGFVQGTEIKKGFDAPSVPEQVKSAK